MQHSTQTTKHKSNHEHEDGYNESVMHSHFNRRPNVTFPAAQHH